MRYSEYLDYLDGIARSRGIPFQGDFELTGHCNLRCKFCYVSSGSARASPDLRTEQWLGIIRQAVEAGMVRATFTGGEVLLRDDFEELYCKTYDMGVRILILTNGLLLDENIAKVLKRRMPDGISMTLYGGSNTSYRNVTGASNGYDRAIKAIELMKGNNLPLSLKTIALPELWNDFQVIRSIADKYELEISLVKYLSPQRNAGVKQDMQWRLDPPEIQKIIRIIGDDEDSLSVSTSKLRTGLANCNCGKGRFAICYDGKMVGCLSYTELCTFPLVDGFSKALDSLRALLFKQSDVCQECTSCSYKEQCTMCPGLNYAESGSISLCSSYRKKLAKYGIV